MAVAYLNDDQTRIIINTTYQEKELIKKLPGVRWHSQDKYWHAPVTWASCVGLRGIFKDRLTINDDLMKWAWKKKADLDKLIELRSRTTPKHGYDPVYLKDLYEFQRAGVQFLFTNSEESALLGDDMGTGKTAQMLSTLRVLGPSALPALIIAPNSVKRTWVNEAQMWYPEAHPYLIQGAPGKRDRIINDAMKDSKALVVVNYESMRTLSRLAGYGNMKLKKCIECDKEHGDIDLKPSLCEVHPRIFNTFKFNTVVADEAHRIKDPKSKQTRATWAMMHGKHVKHRYAITGTPIANHPGDLWSIMHGIQEDQYPTKSKFIDRYALTSLNSFGGLVFLGLNPATKDEFYSFFDPHYRRMRKADVLKDLPPKVRLTRYAEMTPKQRKAYEDIKTKSLTKLEDGSLLTVISQVAIHTRLIQFSSAYATIDDDNNVRLSEPSPKLDILEEILEELDAKQVVVAAESRQLIELAATRLDKLSIKYGMITGHVSQADRDHALSQFQAGKTQVMLFTIKAGGTGLTMTAADTIVFLQRSWSMIENKQAEDRVHRIGSENHESVNIIDIVTTGSIEEDQIERLNEKMRILDEITRDDEHLVEINDSLLVGDDIINV